MKRMLESESDGKHHHHLSPQSGSSSVDHDGKFKTSRRYRLLPSTWLVLLYWSLGLLLGRFYLDPERIDYTSFEYHGPGHGVWIALGTASVMIGNLAYVKVCHHDNRPKATLPMIAIFSLGNGICETFWFLASFDWGADLTRKFIGDSDSWIFAGGFTVLLIFCGVIHALFWLRVLPSHMGGKLTTEQKRLKLVWRICLFAMTFDWAWLYHRYSDFWSITFMHTLTDIFLACVVRYSFFETVQA